MTWQGVIRHRVRTRDHVGRFGIHAQNCLRYVLRLTSCLSMSLILGYSFTKGMPSRNAWYQNISSNTSVTKILLSTRLEREWHVGH